MQRSGENVHIQCRETWVAWGGGRVGKTPKKGYWTWVERIEVHLVGEEGKKHAKADLIKQFVTTRVPPREISSSGIWVPEALRWGRIWRQKSSGSP